jgi:hypothetical protein
VDSISRIFEAQHVTPRNDFCRIFASEGLLSPLSQALIIACEAKENGDDDVISENGKCKIVYIFLVFAMSDVKVKEALAKQEIIDSKFDAFCFSILNTHFLLQDWFAHSRWSAPSSSHRF